MRVLWSITNQETVVVAAPAGSQCIVGLQSTQDHTPSWSEPTGSLLLQVYAHAPTARAPAAASLRNHLATCLIAWMKYMPLLLPQGEAQCSPFAGPSTACLCEQPPAAAGHPQWHLKVWMLLQHHLLLPTAAPAAQHGLLLGWAADWQCKETQSWCGLPHWPTHSAHSQNMGK